MRPTLPPKMLTHHQMQQQHAPHKRQSETSREHTQRLNAMPRTMFNLMPYAAQWRYYEDRLQEENALKSADNETQE
jgi:hypothetical protein